jgi:hypothetical protein
MRPSEPSKQRKALSFSDWIGRKRRISATGGLVMIPIDKLIFFRGVETTDQTMMGIGLEVYPRRWP